MKRTPGAILKAMQREASGCSLFLAVIIVFILAVVINGFLNNDYKVVLSEQIEEAEESLKLSDIEDAFYYDIDEDGIEEKIVRTSDGSWNHKYSFFRHRKLLGEIDFTTQKYDLIPEFRIVNSGKDGNWFVVTPMTATGTGIIRFDDYWYRLSEDGIKKVLGYPIYGNISALSDFARSFKSNISFNGMVGDNYVVNLIFEAAYKGEGDEGENQKDCGFFGDLEEILKMLSCRLENYKIANNFLFSTTKKVSYIWDREREIFTIDEQNSEISEEEIEGLWLDSSDEILKKQP